VVTEVALACVLLVGAGLLLRSFLNALHVDLGFQPGRAVMLQEILRRIDSIPGVEASGVADMLQLGRNRSWQFAAKETEARSMQLSFASLHPDISMPWACISARAATSASADCAPITV
jgi:hypothetical protein